MKKTPISILSQIVFNKVWIKFEYRFHAAILGSGGHKEHRWHSVETYLVARYWDTKWEIMIYVKDWNVALYFIVTQENEFSLNTSFWYTSVAAFCFNYFGHELMQCYILHKTCNCRLVSFINHSKEPGTLEYITLSSGLTCSRGYCPKRDPIRM